MDGWKEFLEARMRVIEAAVQEGKSIREVEDLVNIRGMQSTLLVMRATEKLKEENKS